MIKSILILGSILFSVSVVAASHTCSDTKILKMVSHAVTSTERSAWKGNGYIFLESCSNGNTSCRETDGLVRLVIPSESAQVFSMALSAYHANSSVSARIQVRSATLFISSRQA